MPTIAEKRQTFRSLHESGCFAIPNPWDIGTARYLQHLGFPAIATSSAGFAFTRGLPDYGVPLDAMLAHIHELVDATDIPVNADFENGYAHDPAGVAKNVRLCLATGVAGLSIEDATGDSERPLYELDHAVERVAAARAAIGDSGVVLVARAECFLVGRDDIDDVIQRLSAYTSAGADCLYAPGIRSKEHIAAVVAAVAPKPVNVLLSGPAGLTIADVAGLGVRRVSVGSALARAAWGGFMHAAEEIADSGAFEALGDAMPHDQINDFFREDARRARAAD